jgi:hypothetical protein
VVNRPCDTSNKERSRVVKRKQKNSRPHPVKDEVEERVKRETVYQGMRIQYMCNSSNFFLVFRTAEGQGSLESSPFS